MLFFRTGASAQFEHGTVVEGVCIDSFSLSADYFLSFRPFIALAVNKSPVNFSFKRALEGL